MDNYATASSNESSNSHAFGWVFSWVAGIVILLGLGFSVVALLPVIRVNGSPDPRIECNHNLKQIGISLHSYHTEHGSFPPAYIADEKGRPMHSWRILILPYIGEKDLYDAYPFDEPWNGPNNRKLIEQMPSVYRCPVYGYYEDSPMKGLLTHYVATVGLKSVLRGSESLSINEISDGTSKTLIVIDTNQPVCWMQPTDITANELHARLASDVTSHNHREGIHVLFADGSVKFLTSDISPQSLQALVTADAGDEIPADAF